MRFLIGLLIALVWPPVTQAQPGFLVLAPDRGFLGNEEVREVFAAFQRRVPNSALAFATHEKPEIPLQRALAGLKEQKVVVLPLFLSTHEPLYRRARKTLAALDVPACLAPPFGESYLAEEILFDRIKALSLDSAHEHLILVAYGAEDGGSARRIEQDLRPLIARAVRKYGLKGGGIQVLYDRSAPEAARLAAFDQTVAAVEKASHRAKVLVVPFELGPKFDSRMSTWGWLSHRLSGIRGGGRGYCLIPTCASGSSGRPPASPPCAARRLASS